MRIPVPSRFTTGLALALLSVFGLLADASLATRCQAKNLPLVSIDAAFFRYDASNNFCEVFYSIPDSSLNYLPAPDGGYMGEVYIRVDIGTKAKRELAFHWIVEHRSESANPAYMTDLNGIKSFLLPPGAYEAAITIKDLRVPEDSTIVKVPMQVPAFDDNRIYLSTPILANTIESIKADDTTRFKSVYRHSSFYVIPSASQILSGTRPQLKTYIEVYNSARFLGAGFSARYRILASDGTEKMRVINQHAAKGNAQVLTQSLPVDTLPSGMYYVNIGILDSENQLQTETAKRFYLVNPERPPEQERFATVDERFETSEFATMSAGELDRTWQQFRVLASPNEVAVWERLTEDRAKSRFLFQQWDIRDEDRGTKINEAWEDFKERIEYANTYFGSLRYKEGWQTSRGRVLLKYGQPDDIRRHYSDPETRPYEIWTYTQIQGGVTFVFVDMSNASNFALVHSTALEENVEEDWFERYAKVVPGDATNSSDILQGR